MYPCCICPWDNSIRRLPGLYEEKKQTLYYEPDKQMCSSNQQQYDKYDIHHSSFLWLAMWIHFWKDTKIPRYRRYPLDRWTKVIHGRKGCHILFTSRRPDATAWSRVGKTRQGCPAVHLDGFPMFLLLPWKFYRPNNSNGLSDDPN